MTKAESDRYCRNGDREGFLAQSLKEKLAIKNRRGVMDVTSEEFQYWLFANKKIGDSDGHF